MRVFRQLYVQMIVAILAGTAVGYLFPAIGRDLAPLGLAFVKAMRMMVPPVLFCTLVDAIVEHGGARRTGSTIVRSVILSLAITVAALLIGLLVALVVQPGEGLSLPPSPIPPALNRELGAQHIGGAGDFLLRMVPATFFSAFTAGDVLPVLFIAGLVGFGLLRIGPAGEPIVRGIRSLMHLQFAIFGFLVRAAPVGAFGAIAFTIGTYGLGFIGSLGVLILALLAACLGLVLLLLAIVRIATGITAGQLLRQFREELVIVAGTSSSDIVLPRLMTKLTGLGAPPGVVGLVVPLGYTLNLAGTAVYLIIATLFLSEALDIALSPERVLLYLLVMVVASKTAAGVSGAGFSALLLTLSLMPDIPVAAAAMLIAVDRILSTIRALTSVCANVCGTLLVARWDGTEFPPVSPSTPLPATPPPAA